MTLTPIDQVLPEPTQGPEDPDTITRDQETAILVETRRLIEARAPHMGRRNAAAWVVRLLQGLA